MTTERKGKLPLTEAELLCSQLRLECEEILDSKGGINKMGPRTFIRNVAYNLSAAERMSYANEPTYPLGHERYFHTQYETPRGRERKGLIWAASFKSPQAAKEILVLSDDEEGYIGLAQHGRKGSYTGRLRVVPGLFGPSGGMKYDKVTMNQAERWQSVVSQLKSGEPLPYDSQLVGPFRYQK